MLWAVLFVHLMVHPVSLQEFEDFSVVLETFDTVMACEDKRNSIGFEMAAAYPYERDFKIVCRCQHGTDV